MLSSIGVTMIDKIDITPAECIKGMQHKNRMLTAKNQEYAELHEKYCAAKRDYQVALAQKITMLKLDGIPVSIINKLAEGDRAVAELGYKMNVADGVVKACRESMGTLSSQIDTYRSVLTWLREEMTRG